MDHDNEANSFFGNLQNENSVQDELRRQQRQLSYEERIIKRVFSECGIKINGWGRLANECRSQTAQDKLNFGWFNQAFRGFPGRLCGRRIPKLHELTLQDLFKPTKSNRVARAVAKALAKDEVEGADNRWMFVFPVVRTFFCAYNLDLEVPGPTFSLRDDDGRLAVAMSPTKALFATIGKDWFDL
jgi:hypothetical protein